MKIQLLNSITHDGIEYGRGIYETGKNILEELAQYFLDKFPHAARLHTPDAGHALGEVKAAVVAFGSPAAEKQAAALAPKE